MNNESVWIILTFTGIYLYNLEEGAFKSKVKCIDHVKNTLIPRYFAEQGKDVYSFNFVEHDSHGVVLEWRDNFSDKSLVACELDYHE